MMGSIAETDIFYEKPFSDLDIQIGRVVGFEVLLEKGEKAHRLLFDFGNKLGIRKSSEPIFALGREQDILGKQALCVMDYPSADIARMRAQAFFLGFVEDEISLSKADTISFVELAC